MTVAQIYNIVNDVRKQALGETGVDVVDTSSFISLGNKIVSSETDTDRFLNALVDRIGTTIFSTRRYESMGSGLVRNPFEYGCIVQKIYVDMPEAKENNAWEIGQKGYTPTYAPVIKPSAKQKLFNKISTWEIDVTIPDFMFKTAFTSETQMATFIDAIFTAMDNMMLLAVENNENLVRATGIAHKLKKGSSLGAVNLLAKYNELTTSTLTPETALRNTEFLKWASMEMSKYITRMSKMSKLFNDEEYIRHTPTSALRFDVLQDFASATNTYLQSDTFHNELTKLPNYTTVPYWQGCGVDYSFDDCSTINVTIEDSEEVTGKTTVKQSGIIGVMYDEQALGVTINQPRTTTERNNKDEYTNYYNKANIGYFFDGSENMVVFYLSNTP